MSSNREYVQAMQDLRRGSTTDRHTPKPHKGSRKGNRAAAIRDSRAGK